MGKMKLVHALVGVLISWSCVACGDTASDGKAATNAGGTDSSGGPGNNAGGSTSDSNGSTGVQDDFWRRYAEATCRLVVRCEPLLVLSQTDCEAALIQAQKVALESQAITDGRVVYHPEQLPACIAFLESAACDEEKFEPCLPVFEGTIASGEPCTLDLECAGHGQCLVDGTCPGVCGAAGKLGEPCSSYNACERGLDCGGDPNAQTCRATAKLGESCGDDVACSGYAACLEGKCTSRESLGHSDQGGPCEVLSGPGCKPGLVCTTALEGDVVVGRCQPKVASGAACTFSTPDACPEGEYCHITSASGVKPATGTCQRAPKLGEECRYGTFNITSCEKGQYCDVTTNVCTVKRDIGADCASSSSCSSGACVADKCVEDLECEKSKDGAL